MKPDKLTWREFMRPLLDRLKRFAHATLRLFGRWYCEHCQKHHSPRVRKFDHFDWQECSIGKISSAKE